MMTHLLSPNGMIVLTLTLIAYISTVICTGGAVIVESDHLYSNPVSAMNYFTSYTKVRDNLDLQSKLSLSLNSWQWTEI